MSTQAERLAAVQEIDLRIMKLQKEMQDIPARKKAIEAACEIKKKDSMAAKTALSGKQSEAKQAELQIETVKEKIRKLRGQQLELKSNKEFKVMDEEIRAAEAEIRRIEETELAKMEEIEKASKAMAVSRQIVDKAESEKQAEIAALDARNADISVELQKCMAERAEKATAVDARWLQKYEPLINAKKDRVLAKVEHGVCGGCNMTVAPHVVHDARRGNIMVSCSHCGRLLY